MAAGAKTGGAAALAVAALIAVAAVWWTADDERAAERAATPPDGEIAAEAGSGAPAANPATAEAPATIATPAPTGSTASGGETGAAPPADPGTVETAARAPETEREGTETETRPRPAAPAAEAEAAITDTPVRDAESEAAGSATANAAPAPPVLDIVRVEPDGAGLVAGRATPDSDVEIVVEDKVVGRARADADGGFVAMIATAPDAGAQRVVAREAAPEPAQTEPAREEESTAPVKPAPPASATAIATATSPAPPPAAAPDAARAESSAPVFIIGAAEPDTAPLVVEPSTEGVRLLQGPARGPAAAVALDTISYDASGRVVLAGRAPEGSEVRIYLDEKATGAVETADDGSWTFRPGDEVSPGTYRLRLDEVDATGTVSSRIETPFRREAITPGAAPANEMIVQRGDSLWRIAENVYGAGLRYTLIYGANSDAIRDPDLIYPGQIFDLPETPAAE